MGETGQGGEEGCHPWIPEAQSRRSGAVLVDGRQDHLLEGGPVRRGRGAFPERLEEAGVGGTTDVLESVPVQGAQGPLDGEVVGVVDPSVSTSGEAAVAAESLS
jgi:hypothetical protein